MTGVQTCALPISGEINLAKVRATIMSWLGHAKHADAHNLRVKLSRVTFTKREGKK